MGWRLARSIYNLRSEILAAYPNTTIWTIGDQNHQRGDSDHNPNRYDVVCAADVKADGGMDLAEFVAYLISHPHENLRYVIYRRKIYQRKNGFRAEDYHGSNPHDEHAHVSAGNGPDGRSTKDYDSSDAWNIARLGSPVSPKPKPPVNDWTSQLMSELPTLRMDSSGSSVERAQALLNVSGASLKEDGRFGSKTDYATRVFQRSKGLTSDGIIGRNTWSRLVKG
jgi:hypothetical protein